LAGILVTSHDVTEHVLARQHVRQTTAELAATNAGLADYVVQVCNPGLRALWQCTPAQVLHQPLFAALPELQYQGLREVLDEVSRTGTAAVVPVPPGLGAARALTYSPLRDAQGQTIALGVAGKCGPAGHII